MVAGAADVVAATAAPAAPGFGAQRLISFLITCVKPAAFWTPGMAPMTPKRSFMAGVAMAFWNSASSR